MLTKLLPWTSLIMPRRVHGTTSQVFVDTNLAVKQELGGNRRDDVLFLTMCAVTHAVGRLFSARGRHRLGKGTPSYLAPSLRRNSPGATVFDVDKPLLPDGIRVARLRLFIMGDVVRNHKDDSVCQRASPPSALPATTSSPPARPGTVQQQIKAQLLLGLRAAARQFLRDHVEGEPSHVLQDWRHPQLSLVLSSLLQIFGHGIRSKDRSKRSSGNLHISRDLWEFFSTLQGVEEGLSSARASLPSHDHAGRCREFVRICITTPKYLAIAFVRVPAHGLCPGSLVLLFVWSYLSSRWGRHRRLRKMTTPASIKPPSSRTTTHRKPHLHSCRLSSSQLSRRC